MKFLKTLTLLGGLLTAALAPAGAATLKIKEDRGGVINDYVRMYSDMRDAGTKIVLAGPCVSACTLFLGILPPERYCVTDDASMGFHSASVTTYYLGTNKKPTTRHAPEYSELMWSLYPGKVREKLKSVGWDGNKPNVPHPNVVFIGGDELKAMIRECNAAEVP
jgi:hypothetical protein